MISIKKCMIYIGLLAFTCLGAEEPTTGIQVSAFLNPIGSFASHSANKGWGGWHIDSDPSNVPTYLLTEGVACWDTTLDDLYIYDGVSTWNRLLDSMIEDYLPAGSDIQIGNNTQDVVIDPLNTLTVDSDMDMNNHSITNVDAITLNSVMSTTNTFYDVNGDPAFRLIALVHGMRIQVYNGSAWVDQVEWTE